MNQRRHQRHSLEVDALVRGADGQSWVTKILDFCQTGLLVGSHGNATKLPAWQAGQALDIHLALNFSDHTQRLQFSADIVRRLPHGFGLAVAAPGIAPDIQRQLLAYIGAEPELAAPQEMVGSDQQKQLVNSCSKRFSNALPALFDRYQQDLEQDFLTQASDAENNNAQIAWFAALTEIEIHRDQLKADFIAKLNAYVQGDNQTPVKITEQSADGDLSVVDQDAFESWLAIAVMVSKVQSQYKDELKRLQHRIKQVLPLWQHDESNPFGPAVICYCFDQSLQMVNLNHQQRLRALQAFEASFIYPLGKQYRLLNKILAEEGVFAQEAKPQLRRAANLPTTQQRIASERIREEVVQAPAANVVGEAVIMAAPAADSALVQTSQQLAQSLISLQQPTQIGLTAGVKSTNSARAITTAELSHTAANDQVSLVQLQQAIGQLISQQPQTGIAPVKGSLEPIAATLPRLMAALPNGASIANHDVQQLALVDSLVQTISEDEVLPANAAQWVQDLRLPLAKHALGTEQFLDADQVHPTLAVINNIVALAALATSELRNPNHPLHQQLQKGVDKLREETVELDDFVGFAEQLQPLVDERQKRYDKNLTRTIKTSEGQQRLQRARNYVYLQLEALIKDRQVAQSVLRLLNPAWKNLLVLIYLKQGSESTHLKHYMQTIEQLNTVLLSEDRVPAQGVKLLDRVAKGLELSAFDGAQSKLLLKEIEQGLKSAAMVSARLVPADEVAKLLDRNVWLRSPLLFPEKNQVSKKTWSNAELKVKALNLGDWLWFENNKKARSYASLAFTGDSLSYFIFVNQNGSKDQELNYDELTLLFLQNQVGVLGSRELPMIERATHDVIQKMHNQLAYQANHDAVTGLPNRKAFDREIERLFSLSKNEAKEHVLLYFDLDQFKLVNNSCGHDAGDELLKQLAKLVGEQLPEHGSYLSRLGGDEFGLLLEGCDAEAGLSIAEKIRECIEQFRFSWQQQRYSITTSAGLVVVNQQSTSCAWLLQNADAACIAAKDNGRNRVQVYTLDNADLSRRRDVMQWVREVDSALDDDRLQLNCQQILPISNKANHAGAHYEILLSIVDRQGKTLPPQNFILAAENYDRMPNVDRWVINKTFDWISHNPQAMKTIHGFSINISGNSLDQEHFLEFVFQQFELFSVNPSKIVFEITETAAVSSLERVVEFIEKLKVLGCLFSLDDFGTGLSSYSYLRNLPVDFIKIDGVFVKDLETCAEDYALVRSINEIGHSLGKLTVAEYVENDAIRKILVDMGVDYAQGFGIAKPILIEQLSVDNLH